MIRRMSVCLGPLNQHFVGLFANCYMYPPPPLSLWLLGVLGRGLLTLVISSLRFDLVMY